MKRFWKRLSSKTLRVFAPHVYQWRMHLIRNAVYCALADHKHILAGEGYPNLLEMVLFPFTSPSDAILWLKTYERTADRAFAKDVLANGR